MTEYFQSDFESGISCAISLFDKTGDPEYLDYLFRFIEKSKYMLVFQALSMAENRGKLGLPDSIRERELNLKVKIANLNQLLAEKNQAQEQVNKAIIDSIQAQIFSFNRQQEQLRGRIGNQFPNYYQLKYDSITISFGEARELIPTRTRLLELYWGDSAIYTMSFDQDTVIVDQIELNPDLEIRIQTYLKFLVQPPSVSELSQNYEDFCEISYHLYTSLIENLLAEAKSGNKTESIENLIIVPSGILSYLPFETLITSRELKKEPDFRALPYLVKKYRISYAYSTNLLFKNKRETSRGSAQNLLAFAYSNGAVESADNGRSHHREIPGSAREIESIAMVLGGGSRLFAGEEATETNFKGLSPQFDIIHLAVHGTGDPSQALNSKLIFRNNLDSIEDGNLFAHELYNLDLSRLKLAVLSACETGIGKEYQGEGLFSVARGFAYAGCPSMIMSLWKVQDRITADLMADFYKELVKGSSVDEAICDAKLNFINRSDELTAHPANWSAFIPLGDMNPLIEKSNWVSWRIILIMVILLLIVFGWYQFQARREKPNL